MRKIIGLVCFVGMSMVYAAQPKFSFVPQTETVIDLPINGTVTVAYEVTNQTNVTRTLTMVGMKGITPVTTGSGVCANPFTLASKQSCTLKLLITGSEIPQHITHGPEVCAIQGNGNNNPSLFLCSQPSQANSLNITRKLPERPRLTVKPQTLGFQTVGQTKIFTVKNNSATVTANNIAGQIEGTILEGNVTQNASDCIQVEPGAFCNLLFTSGNVSLEQTFPVKGSNTTSVPATIVIQLPDTALIKAYPTTITLQATNGSSPVSQHITIINPTAPVTATNIAANLTAALTTAGVLQNSDDCASLPAGETCDLIFTPGTQGVTTQSVSISGTHASTVVVNIAVNAASLAPLEITSGNNETLVGDGESRVSMIIQNNSTTETALNIVPDLSASTLEGFLEVISNTCASVQKGATCTITFQAASTSTQVTGTFPISGDNTNQVTATLTINPVPFAYITDLTADAVSHCSINTDGSLTACANDVVASGTDPEGISLSSKNTLAYYTDKLANKIFKCDVTPNTGGLTDCIDSGATGATALEGNTQGIVLNAVLTNVLYVPGHPSTLSTCPLNADGTIGTCTDATPTYGSGTNVSYLLGVALNPTATKAYLVNGQTPVAVYVCDVDTETGALSYPCTDTLAANLPSTIAGIVISADGLKAYISGNQAITTCDVSGNSLNACIQSQTYSVLGTGINIALNTAETLAYVTTDVNSVASCTIDSSTRLITSCSSKTDSIWSRTSGLALLQ